MSFRLGRRPRFEWATLEVIALGAVLALLALVYAVSRLAGVSN